MANLKFVIVLGMLFAISAAVLAETSKDETHVQKMNPTETTQVEPQQANCGCGRRRRCCGACAFGTQCSACCASKLAEAEEEAIVVEPDAAVLVVKDDKTYI
ncbi:PREDICTED: uncharacterized protein LOC104816379 [Tarenaya hassleriana]|uniref:uncharacterized protein LOC104816379 n=1 Tax=Tarenaya hassleriana TaxID=28532 RepID=UPI00053C4AC8|nr:PREDICTED: uncharacterized protein LOC104816379 [Tarenaya hassleriana]